jgi:hypothetical protein
VKLSLVFSLIVLVFQGVVARADALSVPNDLSCTTVPIVKTVAPPSDDQLQSTGFLYETYTNTIDVFSSPVVAADHREYGFAGLSHGQVEVSNPGHSTPAHSLNSVSDPSFMELAATPKSHPMTFDFAAADNTLARTPASVSIAIVDPPITSFAPVDRIAPGAPELISGDAKPKSIGSSQPLIAPIQSMDSGVSFGANADGFTGIDAPVPEANGLHYGLLGICLLFAKFRWDGTRDRRIHREMKRRDVV